MKKILQLAESSMMVNNFSSVLIVTYILQLANVGTINITDPVMFSLSTTTGKVSGNQGPGVSCYSDLPRKNEKRTQSQMPSQF